MAVATKRDFSISYGLQTDKTGTSTGNTLFVDQVNDRVGVGQGSPAYTLDVSGDINFTGTLYKNGTEHVASRWTLTGSDIYRLSKVGINESNPQSQLAVNGYITESTDNGTTYWNVVTQQDIGTDANQVPLNQYLGKLAFLDDFSPNGLRREGGSSDDVVVDSSGNVGIGTDNPSDILHVQGVARFNNSLNNFNLVISTDSGNPFVFVEQNAPLLLGTNSTEKLRITSTGNVGIDDTNPDQKLVVAGNIRTTGSLYGPSNFIIDPSTVGDDTGTVEIKGNLVVQGTTTTINSTTVELNHISLGDNEIANFGNSNDLQIYHDGSNSFMLNSTGELQISSGGSTLFIQAVTNENAIKVVPNAAVELYYDNSQKFQTTSGGVRIGSASAPIDINAYETLNNGTLSFEGSAGQLFSITNSLTSGSIFSVNDVSGIPSIDVDANGTITLAEFGGNVGINQNSPTKKLHVVDARSSTYEIVSKFAGGDGTDAIAGISLVSGYSDTANDHEGHVTLTASREGNGNRSAFTVITADDASTSTEKFRVSAAGNVLIGAPSTYTFQKRLNIQGSSGALISLYNGDTTTYATDTHSSIEFRILTGNTGNTLGTAEIRAEKENGTNGDNSTNISFWNRANGQPSTKRMTISWDGHVGIGTEDPGEKLDVDGTIRLTAPGNHTTYATKLYSRLDSTHCTVLESYINNNTPFELIGSYADNAGVNPRVVLAASGQNVGVGLTNPAYNLEVNGSFAATTKSFIIDHPTKEGMKLRYGSLEGPENGVYVRGKTTEFVIELPDYWTGLVDADTISVNLTPIGKSQTLWVKSIEDNKVIVGSKCTSVEYFYTIYGERKDVEKLEVEIGA